MRRRERCTDAFVLAGTPLVSSGTRRASASAPEVFLSVDPKTFRVRSVHVSTAHLQFWIAFAREKLGVRLPHAEFELDPPAGARPLSGSSAE